MIEQDLYKLMSTSEVANAADMDSMDFVLNLELLNGCAHHCPGCFVNRKNSIDELDLDAALRLAKDMDNKGLRFREVILSPTDIFSATNTDSILTNTKFHELMSIHPKTRITTTAMFDNLDWDRFQEVFSILDNTDFYKEDMILEFLVPMDTQKMMMRDEKYFEDVHRVLNFFKNETPKIVDWSFVVNVHYDPLFVKHFDELTEMAHKEFDTIIEFLPSFFRTGNDSLIEKHLDIWKMFLQESVNDDNFRNVMLTIADKNHNGFNTLVVNYKKGDFYISPFIYEQILSQYEDLRIPELTAQSVIETSTKLIGQQYAYASQTTECESCKWLSTCVGRNVLSFMEIKDIKDCIYPKDVLDLYDNNNVSALSRRVRRCS